MTKFKDAVIYFITVGIVAIIMYFDFIEHTIYIGDNVEIKNVNDLFGRLLAYLLFGILLYMMIIGKMVSDNKTILKNVLILFVGNLFIYSIIFFINPNTRIEYYFTDNSLIYFKGYFIFSVWASFISSKIFYDYRQEINKNGYHRYVFWRYNIQAVIAYLCLYYVFIHLINPIFKQEIFYNNIGNYIVVVIISVIFLIVFNIIDRKKNKLEQEIVKESTKAETATAQFETLKNQLDPHFLFNSLNVLTGLIEENPDNAIDFTTSLSKIYRYVLEQKDKEVIPIQEEINFAKTYVNLLKLRFENSIDFEIEETSFNEQEFIVPLSLQILLENTIKHNIVSESKPLKIRIYKINDLLVVENSLQSKESIKDSTGVGLNNIKNRYLLISNREVIVEKTDHIFRVQLPILTQKTTYMNSQNNIEEHQAYQRALERAKELKKFYAHLGIYIVMSLFFFALNYVTFRGHWWFYWPILGWGLGVAINAVKVYAYGTGWEERKAKEIYEKEQNKKWQ